MFFLSFTNRLLQGTVVSVTIMTKYLMLAQMSQKSPLRSLEDNTDPREHECCFKDITWMVNTKL